MLTPELEDFVVEVGDWLLNMDNKVKIKDKEVAQWFKVGSRLRHLVDIKQGYKVEVFGEINKFDALKRVIPIIYIVDNLEIIIQNIRKSFEMNVERKDFKIGIFIFEKDFSELYVRYCEDTGKAGIYGRHKEFYATVKGIDETEEYQNCLRGLTYFDLASDLYVVCSSNYLVGRDDLVNRVLNEFNVIEAIEGSERIRVTIVGTEAYTYYDANVSEELRGKEIIFN